MVSLLACEAGGPQVTSGSFEPVGTAFFTVKSPPGSGWQIQTKDSSVRMERDDTSWLQTIGKTIIDVSVHPLPRGFEEHSERELANRLLSRENERYYGMYPGDYPSTLVDRMPDRRPLFGVEYSTWWEDPSHDPMWADKDTEMRAEVYIAFPEGPGGSKYYRFEVLVTRVLGWPTHWENLRLIDGVLDSFKVKSAPPAEEAPGATPTVSP
jgi:hypothetical protein